jgi:large subunit ribosomal protein L25
VIDDKAPIKVLIQDLTRDILKDTIEHVDFYAVTMSEKIHTELALTFEGIAPAVKGLGGVLLKNKSHLSIKCLPQDLLKEFTVDISSLNTFEDSILVEDLKLPTSIEVLDQPNDVVALVTPPRSEEELAALNQAVSEDVSKVAGVTKEEKAADAAAAPAKK